MRNDWRRTVIWSVAIGGAMLVFDLLEPMTVDWIQGQSLHWAVGLMSDRAALRVQECLLAFTSGLIVGVLASQLLLLVVYAARGDGNSFTRIVYATFLLTIVTTIISNMWSLRTSSNELVTGIVSAMLLFFF